MISNRKKILIIDNLCVESSRRNLYRLMAEQMDVEVHLLVPRQWKETASEVTCESELSERLHVHTSRILFGCRHHRVLYVKLFHLVKNLRPDFLLAVHAPENYATLQVLAARRFLLPSMKIGLFASRNIDLPRLGFPYKLAFLNSICDWIASKVGVDVIYHRPRDCGDLYSQYTKNRVYMPHSVDSSVFKPHPTQKTRGGDHTVGYVGRLTEEKGVHILLNAFASLPTKARLIVVGEGPRKRELMLLARNLGIADRVRFETSVLFARMPEMLGCFDVLVLPSLETRYWKELFGRVLIEAMACEVPVIGSDSGGIPEVVGDAGILFRPGDVSDLASKLSCVLEDELSRSGLGRRGRQRVKNLFDTPIVAEVLVRDLDSRLKS